MATTHTPDEICERGLVIYEQAPKPKLEPAQRGRFVAIDIDSADYAVGDSVVAAVHKLRRRRPGVAPFIHRIGYPSTVTLGGRFHVRGAG